MKRIVFILISLVLVTGTILAQKKAIISTDITQYDFGNIKEADGKVSHTFKVINKGDSPLVLTRVVASCSCTTLEWSKEPIAPGKEGNLKVTFDPSKLKGVFLRYISIYSNGKSGSYPIKIMGEIK